MDVSESNIYEKSLSEKYSNFFRRVLRQFRFYLILLSIGFLISGMIKGFSFLLFISFIGVLLIFFIISLFDSWKVMSRIVINHSTGMIDVFSFRGNKVYHELSAKSNDIQITVRQNFSYRSTVWGIAFFYRNRRKFYQVERYDWENDVFLEIENEWKKSKSQASSSSEI